MSFFLPRNRLTFDCLTRQLSKWSCSNSLCSLWDFFWGSASANYQWTHRQSIRPQSSSSVGQNLPNNSAKSVQLPRCKKEPTWILTVHVLSEKNRQLSWRISLSPIMETRLGIYICNSWKFCEHFDFRGMAPFLGTVVDGTRERKKSVWRDEC